MYTNGFVEHINLQLFPRLEFQAFANFLRDDDLEFWGDFYGWHKLHLPTIISIRNWYVNISIDRIACVKAAAAFSGLTDDTISF